ncbi:hypothetical protein DFH06DRAFT_1483685 [Mycena polygramma]|nr:hypothetical protein DFH06DRAFT_1483685 [Mycena polygramma]
MATPIVERPLSAFSMSASPSAVPQRRRRNSVEIIDVDSFEEPPAQRRRVEQRRDVIELIDSDEEADVEMLPDGGSGSGSGSRRESHISSPPSSRGQFSPSLQYWRSVAGSSRQGRPYGSPPPRASPSHPIPPVPPLPRRYSGFASFAPPQAPEPRPRGPRVSPPPSSNLNAQAGSSSSRTPIPGPIRALPGTFAFEIPSSPPPEAVAAPAAGPGRTQRDDDEPFDFRPAPRARHDPPMGLGGALISSNNARMQAERLERQRRGERRLAGGRVAPAVALAGGSGSGSRRATNATAPRSSIMRRLASLNPFRWGDHENDVDLLALAHPRDRDDRTGGDAQLALDIFLADQEDQIGARFAHPAQAFARREMALLRGWARRGPVAREEEDYKPEYTHAGPAEGGYVYDFSPSEIVPVTEGKGKGKEVVIDVDAEREKEGVSTLLVCARCLDPLLVRSDGITDGGEEEARRRKVWGLRCGHLIDGKCFEELRKPVEEADRDDERAASPEPEPEPEPKGKGKGKGKGKAKARDAVDSEQEDHDELFDDDEDAAHTTTAVRSRLRSSHASGSAAFEAPAAPDTSTVRSRLRSSGGAALDLGALLPPPPPPRRRAAAAAPAPFDLAAPLPAHPRRRAPPKRKGKGKGKAKKPVVEARYEWTCPVAGCGRVHVSEKIDGVWGNAPDKGAIGVFV